MLDGLLKSKFYAKCKVAMKATKTRIDMVRRKRRSTEKFMKNDVVDLLKGGLDTNAYGRVEGLWKEINFSSCYDYVEQCCDHLLTNLSAMDRQRECPDECREAASSLMFAAARFSDLPDLRELRSLFTDRYGNTLECYANKEFVNKLTSSYPPREVKIQLMQEIAAESGFQWDSTAFVQKLQKAQDIKNREPEKAGADEGVKAKPDGRNLSHLSNGEADIPPLHSKAQKTTPEVLENWEKAANNGLDGNTNGKPRSVRRKPQRNWEDQDKAENVKPASPQSVKIPNGRRHVKDEEERALDKLLLHYSRKSLPGDTEELGVAARPKDRAIHARTASLPAESSPKAATTRLCARASSFEPEVMNANHGPKIIEYADFVARLAALRETLK